MNLELELENGHVRSLARSLLMSQPASQDVMTIWIYLNLGLADLLYLTYLLSWLLASWDWGLSLRDSGIDLRRPLPFNWSVIMYIALRHRLRLRHHHGRLRLAASASRR